MGTHNLLGVFFFVAWHSANAFAILLVTTCKDIHERDLIELLQNMARGQAWWHTPVIPVLGRLR